MLTIALTLAALLPQDRQWTWADFEVCGQRTVTRAEILEHVPLDLGTPYEPDHASWAGWGKALEERFGFHRVMISAVRFADTKAYLTIDVVEEGDEARLAYREPPSGSFELPSEVDNVFADLAARRRELFESGVRNMETAVDGHLEYEDELANEMVAELLELVPPHRERLLRIVAEDADASRRARAATLLHWAGDVEDSIRRVHGLVDDPDGVVRNNITRFMLAYVGDLESPETRRSIARAMGQQLTRPSHADRNKSIYALLHLAEGSPDDRAWILEHYRDEVERVAEQSILSNVGDVARELLALEGAE